LISPGSGTAHSLTSKLKQRDAVLELLGPSAVPVDELIRECQLSPWIVITILLGAELAGQVEQHLENKENH